MVSVRQRSVVLSDEALRAAEELSLIEQSDVDDFVSTLIVSRSRVQRAPSDEGEISEISSLLSSILADTERIVPATYKLRSVVRDSPQRRRRLLAR